MKVTDLFESKNHMGETEYQTYSAWRRAIKKAHPDAWFDGDADICQAMVGPKDNSAKGVGEWGGDTGSVYAS